MVWIYSLLLYSLLFTYYKYFCMKLGVSLARWINITGGHGGGENQDSELFTSETEAALAFSNWEQLP